MCPLSRMFELSGIRFLLNILYTNTKLYRVGFTTDNVRSFCKLEPYSLNHLLIYCIHSNVVGGYFEHYFYSLTNGFIAISLQDVLIGIITSVINCLDLYMGMQKGANSN